MGRWNEPSFATVGDSVEGNFKSGDNALVVALARDWQWQEELESGGYSTVEELALFKSVDRSYAGRLLKLT